MVDDKRNSRKIIIAGLVIGALLVCLLLAAAVLMSSGGSNGATSVQGEHVLKLKAGSGTVTDSQLSQTKSILQNRFQERGYSASISTMRDNQSNAYVLVDYGNMPYNDAVTIATTPGVFEVRIQTSGNQSEHVLYGDDVKEISPVSSYADANDAWGISFSLTTAGAQKFQQACIDSGATKDPDNHTVMMLLDSQVFYNKPMSSELASSISKKPADTFRAMTGTGDQGKALADQVYMCLREGSLPISLEIVSP
jgi:preprotein translocase subunit SecD